MSMVRKRVSTKFPTLHLALLSSRLSHSRLISRLPFLRLKYFRGRNFVKVVCIRDYWLFLIDADIMRSTHQSLREPAHRRSRWWWVPSSSGASSGSRWRGRWPACVSGSSGSGVWKQSHGNDFQSPKKRKQKSVSWLYWSWCFWLATLSQPVYNGLPNFNLKDWDESKENKPQLKISLSLQVSTHKALNICSIVTQEKQLKIT